MGHTAQATHCAQYPRIRPAAQSAWDRRGWTQKTSTASRIARSRSGGCPAYGQYLKHQTGLARTFIDRLD